MKKIDYKKDLKEIYNPSSKAVSFVKVPKFNFLMIDGEGDPNNSKLFQSSVEALYSIAYKIKFSIKKDQGIDYGVMPLEGLWWADDMNKFNIDDKSNWKWTLMIMQPELVTKTIFKFALEESKKKKSNPSLDNVRFESFAEGTVAQIMHIGPFSEEKPNIDKIHDAIKSDGNKLSGKHHEIYLNDFTKVDPKKMKTVIRQPYTK